MNKRQFTTVALSSLLVAAMPAVAADEYQQTIARFKKAGDSAKFFDSAFGYAVFPNIGKGAVAIGAAYGKGRVYRRGKYIGNTSMSQLSIGFALGGEGYSQIVFFEDERALNEFTSGNFEFGADASATAITASAGVSATTTGSSTDASGSKDDAKTKASGYYKGMATFTIVKGGMMYEASVKGQKFSYTPLAQAKK